MPQLIPGHQVQLLQGTQELFPALTAAMDAAQYDIRMETYIFDFTSTGAQVASAMVRAAQRGLRVQLVVDGVGTAQLPVDWHERFDAAGVQWRVYNPLGQLGLLIPSRWRRLHRKLVVIDGGTPSAIAFCGGINILDDFHDPNHGELASARFDFSVRVTGPLVDAVLDATSSLWQRLHVMQNLRPRYISAAVTSWMSSRAAGFRSGDRVEQAIADHHTTSRTMKARLILRDNLRNRKMIERAYLKAIGEAQQELIIANAYFLPGGKLRKAIIRAAQRGVKVQLLLQGRYEYFMQYHAARPVYSALLAAGVEIYEYAPSFLHAKVAVVDADQTRAWSTVGSSNLDPLSLLLAHEANVVVSGSAFAQTLRERLMVAIEHGGQRIDPASYAHRPWQQRALDRVAYAIMRTALWITGNRY